MLFLLWVAENGLYHLIAFAYALVMTGLIGGRRMHPWTYAYAYLFAIADGKINII